VTTYLDRIVHAHRAAAATDTRSVDELRVQVGIMGPARGFRRALADVDGLGVIGEVKRRSPSKGELAGTLDPAALAARYAAGGATCLSVLTDHDFFGGSIADLQAARAACSLPVLRKDFTVATGDVLDARLMGADAVLLIVAALDDAELARLHALSLEIGLDALVEIHDEAELERALAVGAALVGVNQRDLVTFAVDTTRAVRLAPLIPEGVVRVAESGVTGPGDAARLAAAGYHAVLVGESLVTASDPIAAVAALRAAPRPEPAPGGRGSGRMPAMASDTPSSETVPHPVFALSDRFVDDLAARSPMTATYLGIGGHDHEWDDTTPAGRAAQAEFLRDYRRQLADLPPAVERWDALAVRIFDEQLVLELEPFDHGDHRRDLGHMQSLFPQLRDTFAQMDTTSATGWQAIIARLAGIGAPLAGLRACLEEGMQRDQRESRRQTESIVSQLRASVAPDGAFTSLAAGFADSELTDAGGDLDGLAEGLRDALDAAGSAVEDTAKWLEEVYLPGAVEHDGVGEERYARHARSFLGSDLDLSETYRWGWDHLGELRAEMEGLAAEIDPDRDLAGVVAVLNDDPTRAASTPEEFRSMMLERERQAMDELSGTHFDIPPEIRPIDVRLAPMGAALGAYFVPPSEDFSRPGTTWWSLGDQQVVPVWSQVTTAYHEGFPGHHLQCGLQTCLGDRLSRVHRLLFWLPGYGEGWALYAERLMRELGYFDRPEYVLGLLAANALRAVRVVVDIGLHLDLPIPDDVAFHPGERWTFDLAVEALGTYAFEPRALCVSEVTRYLGWPGQAISYKVGERAILALREEVRAKEGEGFDLKEFHQRVLGSGPVGLDHLRDIVLA